MNEAQTMSAMNPMPICHLRPAEQRRKTAKGVYSCPVFIHDRESLSLVARCHASLRLLPDFFSGMPLHC